MGLLEGGDLLAKTRAVKVLEQCDDVVALPRRLAASYLRAGLLVLEGPKFNSLDIHDGFAVLNS